MLHIEPLVTQYKLIVELRHHAQRAEEGLAQRANPPLLYPFRIQHGPAQAQQRARRHKALTGNGVEAAGNDEAGKRIFRQPRVLQQPRLRTRRAKGGKAAKTDLVAPLPFVFAPAAVAEPGLPILCSHDAGSGGCFL